MYSFRIVTGLRFPRPFDRDSFGPLSFDAGSIRFISALVFVGATKPGKISLISDAAIEHLATRGTAGQLAASTESLCMGSFALFMHPSRTVTPTAVAIVLFLADVVVAATLRANNRISRMHIGGSIQGLRTVCHCTGTLPNRGGRAGVGFALVL